MGAGGEGVGGVEWEKIIIFQQEPISQPQASLCPKGNISIPLLMEQISNQNMYSKIIEAMHCQHIMLPSAFPGARNQLSTPSGVTKSRGNAEMSELMKGGEGCKDNTTTLLLFGCSRQCLEESFQRGRGQL